MKQTLFGAIGAGVLIVASSAAQAALIDRGGGLIYDTDLNITWLANANYASSSWGVYWTEANAWAANLSYYDSVRNVTYTDWRLPKTATSDPTCPNLYADVGGLNCTGGEMGHLFYTELSGVAYSSILTGGDPDLALFQNIKAYRYWSNTEWSPGAGFAWYFDFSNGVTAAYFKEFNTGGNPALAWAVRDGDVAAASVVPVPAAVWLFASGLLGLLGMSRKRRC